MIKAQESTSTALNVGFFKSCPLCLSLLQLYYKVQAEEMRVTDSKPRSKFPSSKGKEKNMAVHTALISSTNIHASEVPD